MQAKEFSEIRFSYLYCVSYPSHALWYYERRILIEYCSFALKYQTIYAKLFNSVTPCMRGFSESIVPVLYIVRVSTF